MFLTIFERLRHSYLVYAMNEYDEPSDVEMVPIEEIERIRAILKPEARVTETSYIVTYCDI